MAERISRALGGRGLTVTMKQAGGFRPEELQGFDLLILGSSTWSDGDLHEDFDPLERGMRDLDLKGRKGAVFGSGNSRFRFFCEAVDILETRLKHCGAELVIPSLKTDVMEKNSLERAEAWGEELAAALS